MEGFRPGHRRSVVVDPACFKGSVPGGFHCSDAKKAGAQDSQLHPGLEASSQRSVRLC